MSGVATLRVNNKERISTAGKPPTEVRAGEYVIETDEVVVRTQREDSDGLYRLCPSPKIAKKRAKVLLYF